MEPLGLVLDAAFEEHDPGPGHPERPARARAVARAVESLESLRGCPRIEPESAGDELLTLVHDAEHVRRAEQVCAAGERYLDFLDVGICEASARVARLAAGSLVRLCCEVRQGSLRRGFAAVRPPGHHAERDLAMGFCLFNNAAIAARDLLVHGGLSRVMVVDWDVHHGNGTQHLLEEDPGVFYFSVHQSPLYPGTGMRSETGRGAGEGTTLNCPLPPGAGDDAFLGALRDDLVPAAERYRPEFVLVSAGFDAHRDDPLAGLEVSTEAYREATRIVCELADRHAGGRLVSTLEGGYDLAALTDAVTLHLEGLLAD